MPANFKVSFSQQAIVHEATGLWGFLMTTNSLRESDRKVVVAASYCRRVSIGHKLVLSGKDGKKNSLRTLSCEDCFAKVAGRKATPSCMYRHLSSWSAARSAEWDGLVNDNNITNVKVSNFNDKEDEGPRLSMYCSTIWTSQVEVYLGSGGLTW